MKLLEYFTSYDTGDKPAIRSSGQCGISKVRAEFSRSPQPTEIQSRIQGKRKRRESNDEDNCPPLFGIF